MGQQAALPPQKPILPEHLVDLNTFVGKHPVKVDLVYSKPGHPDNMFGIGVYRRDAKMWCHVELAPLVMRAADICFAKSKLVFELKDCLRPYEAQLLMLETDIVKANPRWLEEPGRLLSPPGKGGHPRGMAIDIILLTENGDEVDMGTRFDYLTKDPAVNPAARNYTTGFSAEVLANRKLLEDCMLEAAKELGKEIVPLPQEWWDFRFKPDYSNTFAFIRDFGLPVEMRMVMPEG